MKTLYESILSSTNSGKNKEIDIKYLLKNGFDAVNADAYRTKGKDGFYHIVFTDTKGRIYVTVQDPTHPVITYRKHINTITDLDLVKKYWKAIDNNNLQMEKSIGKKIEAKLTTI